MNNAVPAIEVIDSFCDLATQSDSDDWLFAIQQICPEAFGRLALMSELIHDPRFKNYTDEKLGTHWIAQELLRLVPLDISKDDFFRVVEFLVEREKALQILGLITTESGTDAQ